jgi:hypothetical protein
MALRLLMADTVRSISGRSKLCPFSSRVTPKVVRHPRASTVGLRGAGLTSFPHRLFRRLLAFRSSGHLMNLWHAATQVALYRGARHRAVGAEHAAIAREGLEPFATALAVIEELAGIGRHRLDSLIAAFGASECGLKLHTGSCFALSIPRLAAGSFRH